MSMLKLDMATLCRQRQKEVMIKLHPRGLSRRVNFASFFVVILNHERVIWNTSVRIPGIGQKYTEGHTLTAINSTGSIQACCFPVLLEFSRKARSSEDRLRSRSDPCEMKVA